MRGHQHPLPGQQVETTVRMVVYPRQPHGIQEPKLMQDAMQRNLDWFDRWVLGQGAPAH